ncbi:hypothetical protein RvY_10809 [Ramazzottius varieornatus]|uniref:Uncharacterized protein n=1 Tax=Ramazzottius varieornatus TaxID=947166 RepID=A0A1D1VG17_RAMVA|nr:hypothetical protein RvY_10809 [Ramazzottius varieornatus]
MSCRLLGRKRTMDDAGLQTSSEPVKQIRDVFSELARSPTRRQSLDPGNAEPLLLPGQDLDEVFDGTDDLLPASEALMNGNCQHSSRPPALKRHSLSVLTALDACIICDEDNLCEILKNGVTRAALNKKDPKTGRTGLAYACAQGYLGILDILVGMGPILDVNAADNEGNTPLHLAAEAGHADVLSNLLAYFRDIHIDSRNHNGLTPLMKACIQGRTNCAKILLVAGACPALRDGGRCLCATEWARLCGRHATAEVLEKFPHTSCLLHPNIHPVNGTMHERPSSTSPRLVYHPHHPSTASASQTARTVPNGSAYHATHALDSPKALTARRTFRASSEPNIQARLSLQLTLEQLQKVQVPSKRRPSWLKTGIKHALGMDRSQRKSLEPGSAGTEFDSSHCLGNVMNSNLPFSCVAHRGSPTSEPSHIKPRPVPFVIPKVKIHHTDSQPDMNRMEHPEKKHKLDFKRVMLFRKRSASTGKSSSKKI